MEKIFIKDLKASQNIQSIFLVKEKSLGVDKKGNPYLSLVLSDKTGHVDGRVWDQAERFNEEFEVDDFLRIKGIVQKYQNRNQLIVHSLELISSNEIQISDFLPTSLKDRDLMFEEIKKMASQIEDPHLKELSLNILNDPEIFPLYRSCPAAKSVHHAYIGGLLEHSLSMCQLAIMISDHYKELDPDLLIFGAIFHDIGKIWELSFETHIGYTDQGRLIGHISLGCELIEKKCSEIPNFPSRTKDLCKHLILSHHGQLEYGSPKRPKFLEAICLNYIDEMDSRMNSIMSIMRDQIQAEQDDPDDTSLEMSKRWSNYNSQYERYFYLEHFRRRLKKETSK